MDCYCFLTHLMSLAIKPMYTRRIAFPFGGKELNISQLRLTIMSKTACHNIVVRSNEILRYSSNKLLSSNRCPKFECKYLLILKFSGRFYGFQVSNQLILLKSKNQRTSILTQFLILSLEPK
jgi:hypothetical protein